MLLERFWKVRLSVILVALLVRVFTIEVSPCGLATLWVSLGVTLLLEKSLELLLVLGRISKPDLLVVTSHAGSVDSNVQVVSSQPCDDLQKDLLAAAQVGRDLGADAVRPAPMLWKNSALTETCI